MICRRCQRQFRDPGKGACPYCGETNPPVISGVMKTSTILISVGRTDAVYRSVDDVPQPLRKRLLRSTSGMNARTILIADPKGKEELAKAIRRLPGNAQQKLLNTMFGETGEAALGRFLNPQVRKTITVVAAAALALASVWFAVVHRW
jgi:hypothetical protein